jgi:hypothetical protein
MLKKVSNKKIRKKIKFKENKLNLNILKMLKMKMKHRKKLMNDYHNYQLKNFKNLLNSNILELLFYS